MSEIKKEEIDKYWREYISTHNAEVRELLIVHYLYLVKFVVGRVAAGLPQHVKMEDLYSSGVTGLLKAIEKFDPSKNSKFETYAIFLVKGAIIDELRKLDWIPRSIHQKEHQVAQAQASLQQTLGREPDDSELSAHLGIKETELEELLAKIRPAILVPLNAESSNGDEESTSILEKIADTRAELSSETLEKREFSQFLESAISDLPEQERQVLILYYYEEMMLKEIGKILGVTESRVSQIHTKALLKLRGKLRSAGEEFALLK